MCIYIYIHTHIQMKPIKFEKIQLQISNAQKMSTCSHIHTGLGGSVSISLCLRGCGTENTN